MPVALNQILHIAGPISSTHLCGPHLTGFKHGGSEWVGKQLESCSKKRFKFSRVWLSTISFLPSHQRKEGTIYHSHEVVTQPPAVPLSGIYPQVALKYKLNNLCLNRSIIALLVINDWTNPKSVRREW